MNDDDTEKHKERIAQFRFGIIGDLINEHLSGVERKRLIREKASRLYDIPGSGKTKIVARTIKQWFRLHKRFGYNGLIPKTRKDTGLSKALQPAEAALLMNYLDKNPDVNPTNALKELTKMGAIETHISKSALSRFMRASGYDAKSRKEIPEEIRKFEFKYPLECIQCDDMHAFPVPDDKGKMKKAILIAFIDDATRRIIYANFSFTERSLEFETGIHHILFSHGRIIKLYTDNGSTFVSHETQRILNCLGIPLIHSRPGIPKGRGKIERFFRRVREQFLRLIDQSTVKSLADLNARFHTWLESDYHRTPHDGLNGMTPLDAWMSKVRNIIPYDHTVDIDEVFMYEVTRRVYKDSTVTVKGTLFEIPSELIGKRIRLRYNPHYPMTHLKIFHEGRYTAEARLVDSYANTKVKRNQSNKNTLIPLTENSSADVAMRAAGFSGGLL